MKSIGLIVTLAGAGLFAAKDMLAKDTLNAGKVLAILAVFWLFYGGLLFFVKGRVESKKKG
jgi:hypothetical protein